MTARRQTYETIRIPYGMYTALSEVAAIRGVTFDRVLQDCYRAYYEVVVRVHAERAAAADRVTKDLPRILKRVRK